MNTIKFIQASAACYSLWSGVVAVVLLSFSVWGYTSEESIDSEMLFFMVLALFHGIFAIWFWQGRQLLRFIYSSIYSRLLLAGVYWFSAWQLYKWGDDLDISSDLAVVYLSYLLIHGTVDFIGATLSLFLIRGHKIHPFTEPGKEPNKARSLEIKNRFLFALYMIAIGGWLLFSTESFLSFFYLPKSEFSVFDSSLPSIPGPIHLISALIIVLAVYNLVAVKYRLHPLILAGVKGGLFTCLFILLLVASGILHPITLLLPAVDLISVGAILLLRSLRWVNANQQDSL